MTAMLKHILNFTFLLIFLSCHVQAASENRPSLNFRASEMVVMSLEEWTNYNIAMPHITEALSAYHALQPYQQSLKNFYLEPNKYFNDRLAALKKLIHQIPEKSRSVILKKLLSQAKNKLSYIYSLPDMLDPRCSYTEEDCGFQQKNLIIRDSYWTEFLDPLHRSGPEMTLYKALWRVSSIPNYFIYLETIEHSPLLEKYAPQNHQVKYYHTAAEREEHKLRFKNGIAFYGKNKFDTAALDSPFISKGYAIFILATDGEFYINNYDRFYLQHSSEFAGQEILAAGEIYASNGKIHKISNKSGHYSPTLESTLIALQAFLDKSVPLKDITVSAILGKGASSLSVRAYYNASELLLNDGKALCTSALFNWTPLHIAVWQNQFSLAKNAVKSSPINALNSPGLTALHIAVQGGYLNWISYLLNQDANSNLPNPQGYIPLHIAAEKGDLDAIKLLYKHSDASMLTNSGESALLLAIKSGNQEALEYLLKKNEIDFSQESWPLDDRDNHGNGPLYYAVASNNIEMLLLLLNKTDPQNVFELNFQGATLLHAAAAYGSPEIFDMLLENGIDPSLIDNMGNNLLHYAANHNNRLMVEYLADHNFTWMLQIKNHDEETPLHYAANNLAASVFEILLPLADDVNVRDSYGNTPLFYAVQSGNIRHILSLLKNGADIYASNNDGLSPIHISAASLMALTLNALLCQEDVIDLLDAHGNTPLQIALKHHNTAGALYLIPYNSVKMLFNENDAGENAIDLAMKLKDRVILDEINKVMSPH